MNAIKFIKDHGFDKAREVVEGAPARSNWYQVKGKYSNDLYSCNHEIYGEAIMLSEIKRLVESVDIISKFDSVQEAKDAISNSPDGATHYRFNKHSAYLPMYYKYLDSELWIFIIDDWYLSSDQSQQLKPL